MTESSNSPHKGELPITNLRASLFDLPGSQFLANIPIRRKLTLGFGIIMFSTLIVIGLSLLSGSRVSDNINRTSELRAPLVLAASQAQAQLLTMVADVRGYLALGDAEYQTSYITSSEQFGLSLANLDSLLGQNPEDTTTANLQTQLDTLKSIYEQWRVLPDQLFTLHDDQLQREPALRILIEEGNPVINQVTIATRSIIQTQRQRDATAENMDVLADIANFQTSYFTLVSALRSYVATGNRSFKFEYDSNLLANDQAWENLVANRELLYFNQANQLDIIEENRAILLGLTPQIFDSIEGEHAREDLFLFRTEAVPLIDQMITILNEITVTQQQLLQTDLQEGTILLSQTQNQNLVVGTISLALGIFLALGISASIVRPIRNLTIAAEKIGMGDLNSRATVTSRDEVGTLASTFNSMAYQLRQTLDDLELRRGEQEVIAKQLQQQNIYLSSLHQIALGLIGRLDLNELLEDIITKIGQLSQTSHGFVYLTEPGEFAILELKIGTGLFQEQIGRRAEPGKGIVGSVWLSGQALIVDDYDSWKQRDARIAYNSIRKIMAVPLIRPRGEYGPRIDPIGVIGIAYTPDAVVDLETNHLELLTRFAELTSIAIDNARLYADAQEARHAAERADQSKSDFLSSVSHELRTPLTSVMGFAKIIDRELERNIFPNINTDDRKVKRAMRGIQEDLGIIIDEGQRLTSLINNVLDLAKIEAGKIDWDMQQIPIADVIQRASSATISLFELKKLSLRMDIEDNLPLIVGDKDKLIQVVINLISNAVKFTDDGSVTCRVRQMNQEIRVSIIDTGLGISPEDQPKVFEKFKQVGNTLTDKPKGTGLGLPICKEIVEHHGGHIWVESELGVGSTFIFSLPIMVESDEDSSLQPNFDTLIQHLAKFVPATNHPAAPHILVVDDEPHIRTLLRKELEAQSYVVSEAQDGVEAVNLIKQIQPSVVILDVLMPGISGFDVATILKNSPDTMNIPVIMLSVIEDKERGYKLGVDRYLTKPFNVQSLFDEINSLIEHQTQTVSGKAIIADVNPTRSNTLTRSLSQAGYIVSQVDDKSTLLQVSAEENPDLILLSHEFPDQSDMIRHLRVDHNINDLTILIYNNEGMIND